jgi:glyoxylase-like metal-dependent hydrolase (beta-lactamase superfamily II)
MSQLRRARTESDPRMRRITVGSAPSIRSGTSVSAKTTRPVAPATAQSTCHHPGSRHQRHQRRRLPPRPRRTTRQQHHRHLVLAATFPNARYVTARTEDDYWSRVDVEPSRRQMLDDSVEPVRAHGLLDLIDVPEGGTELLPGLTLMPTPGHTPGQITVSLNSGGTSAIITGDFPHHPVQLADPALGSCVDIDPDTAAHTRTTLLNELARTDTLLLGSHFPPPPQASCDGTATASEDALAQVSGRLWVGPALSVLWLQSTTITGTYPWEEPRRPETRTICRRPPVCRLTFRSVRLAQWISLEGPSMMPAEVSARARPPVLTSSVAPPAVHLEIPSSALTLR